jgi:hypothetical protein
MEGAFEVNETKAVNRFSHTHCKDGRGQEADTACEDVFYFVHKEVLDNELR